MCCSEQVQGLSAMFGDAFLGRFMGKPADVAQALLDLEGFGIERIQITPFAPGTLEALRPHLGLEPRQAPS